MVSACVVNLPATLTCNLLGHRLEVRSLGSGEVTESSVGDVISGLVRSGRVRQAGSVGEWGGGGGGGEGEGDRGEEKERWNIEGEEEERWKMEGEREEEEGEEQERWKMERNMEGEIDGVEEEEEEEEETER
ncbi:hypothetical protein Pmani_036578 [Petrolisthes manimaculis]|uniref:Uncharacterized protein n=1 Tax=Petrolisthes manimaculis TaxID=1843537 RepID=A0AAE1TLZ7_9EUCA|nr:hypothetical protein Pmani_036578 [Petrolisthes manimaculis]